MFTSRDGNPPSSAPKPIAPRVAVVNKNIIGAFHGAFQFLQVLPGPKPAGGGLRAVTKTTQPRAERTAHHGDPSRCKKLSCARTRPDETIGFLFLWIRIHSLTVPPAPTLPLPGWSRSLLSSPLHHASIPPFAAALVRHGCAARPSRCQPRSPPHFGRHLHQARRRGSDVGRPAAGQAQRRRHPRRERRLALQSPQPGRRTVGTGWIHHLCRCPRHAAAL